MKSISATSNLVVCKFIMLSLLCVGVGACAADPDSTAVEENADTVGVATEELVTQTLIQLHGSEPPTFQVQTVTRAQQNAELVEREQWLQSAPASEPEPGEGQERLGTAQEAILVPSPPPSPPSCPTSALMMSDGTSFSGTHTLCVSGTGTIDLGWVCRSTGTFPPFTGLGTCATNDNWMGDLKSYSTRNNIGFFSNNCVWNSYVFGGSTPACSLFGVNTVHNTVSSCEGNSAGNPGLVLTLGTSFYICGNENTGGH